jgi:hypothetical protein
LKREGYLSDSGEEIDPSTVPIPELCMSCTKNNVATEETMCMCNRMDQMDLPTGERFLCFAYEPIDTKVNKKKILREMEKYLANKNKKGVDSK